MNKYIIDLNFSRDEQRNENNFSFFFCFHCYFFLLLFSFYFSVIEFGYDENCMIFHRKINAIQRETHDHTHTHTDTQTQIKTLDRGSRHISG